MNSSSVRRIALIGTSGSGKTTLGRELARRMGVRFIEVDELAHGPNWVVATDEALRADLDAAMASADGWIIDRTARWRLGDFVSASADLILWLDLPLPTVLSRLLRRSFRRAGTGEALWNGNVETWRRIWVGRDAILIGAIWSHFRDRREWPCHPHRDKIVRLRTPDEVERWLEAFDSEGRAPVRPQWRGASSPLGARGTR